MGINNLDVNVENFKKKKRMKLVKRIVAATLAATITASGWIAYFNKKNHKSSEIITPSYSTSIDYENETAMDQRDMASNQHNGSSSSVNINSGGIIYQSNDLANNGFVTPGEKEDSSTVVCSNYEYNQFIEKLNNLETEYFEEELYNVDNCLQEYYSTPRNNYSHQHNTLLGKNSITTNELISIVKENNSNYLKTADVYKKSFLKEMDNKTLKNVCDIIVSNINDTLQNEPAVDNETLLCFLGSLKIFADSSLSNARVNEDNCLCINPIMMNMMSTMVGSEKDAYKYIIDHEIEHFKQCDCCGKGLPQNSKSHSFWFEFEDQKVNALNNKWAVEAAAAKNASKRNGNIEITDYPFLVRYFNTIQMSSVLRDENKADTFDKLFYSKNLDDLFNYFGCKTKEDKSEIIKMFFALEIIQMKDEGFYKAYQEKYGMSNVTQSEIDEINYKLKPSICKTATKIFYRSLAEKVMQGKLNYQDAFYLIALFESTLNVHLQYNSSDKAQYDKEFVDWYLSLQDEFFALMASSEKYSQEEIANKYMAYSIWYEGVNGLENNYSLSGLTNDKKNYFKEREEFLKSFSEISIREAKELGVYAKLNNF